MREAGPRGAAGLTRSLEPGATASIPCRRGAGSPWRVVPTSKSLSARGALSSALAAMMLDELGSSGAAAGIASGRRQTPPLLGRGRRAGGRGAG